MDEEAIVRVLEPGFYGCEFTDLSPTEKDLVLFPLC